MTPEKNNGENKLTELHKLFQKITESVQEFSIVLLDEKGIILTWNKGIGKIFGYTADEIINQHFNIFFAPDDRQVHIPEQLLEEARVKSSSFYVGRRIRKNGSIFWGRVEISAVRDQEGKVIGYTQLANPLSSATDLGNFWFDDEGILNVISSREPHTNEKITEFRSILRSALRGQRICCIADIRDADLSKVGKSFSNAEVPEIYRAVAFVSENDADQNTAQAISTLPGALPTRVFKSREEARVWIKRYL
jgi:PAS domain S-box-containing protein